MPLLWRYLLAQYFKVFFLCVAAIVVILLTMRLDEIISFAILGPGILHIIWFIVQQIPYILPIAMPIGALVSSALLIKGLSQTHELSALRACGFSLRDIFVPIVVGALFLSLVNFYVISELSTTSHLSANALKKEMRAVNPLLLVNNKNLMQVKGFYFDTLGASLLGEFAQDVLFLSPSKHGGRLHLMVAKQLKSSSDKFVSEKMTLLTARYNPKDNTETLVLENINESHVAIRDFAQQMLDNGSTSAIENQNLVFSSLVIAIEEARENLNQVLSNPSASKVQLKQAYAAFYSIIIEMIRRISIGLSVLTFTLLGLAFSISISRNQSNRNLFFIAMLGTFAMMSFFIANGLSQALLLATLFYLLPHVVIWVAAFWMLRRISHGIE